MEKSKELIKLCSSSVMLTAILANLANQLNSLATYSIK